MPDTAPLISVIVPVYRVEAWVERCVTSVLQQTLRPIELILVDDCGGDRSMALARQAVERNGVTGVAVKYLAHERNRGLSVARNTALQAARGQWVYFLDSDDALPHDALQRLYEAAVECRHEAAVECDSDCLEECDSDCLEGCDFVMGDYRNIGGEDVHQPLLLGEGVHRQPEILDTMGLKWSVMGCNKLVNLEFLRRNGLYFKEGLIHEDNLWTLQVAVCARSMGVVRAVTYDRYVRPGSITTSEDMDAELRTSGLCVKLMHDYLVRQGLQRSYGGGLAVGSVLSHLGRGMRVQGSSAWQAHRAVRGVDPRSRGERWAWALRHPKTEVYLLSYLLPAGLKSALKRITGGFA